MTDEELYEFGYNEIIGHLDTINNLIEKLPKEYKCQDDLEYIAAIYTDLTMTKTNMEQLLIAHDLDG